MEAGAAEASIPLAEIAAAIRRSGAVTASKVRRQLRAWRVDLAAWRHSLLDRAGAIELGRHGRRFGERIGYLRSHPAMVAVAAAILLLAVLAFLVGRSLPADDAAPAQSNLSTSVQAGPLRLSDGIGWQRATVPSQVAQLVPAGRVVAPSVTDISVVLGPLATDRVPQWFDALGIRRASAREFMAGRVAARAYKGTLPGSGQVAVNALLVPTSAGAATVICLGGSGRETSGADDDCRAVMSTVALAGATAGATSPSSAAASAVDGLVSELNSRRVRDASLLSRAATPGRQANAAFALQADYSAAAQRAGAIEFTGLAAASGADLRARLRATADAYGAMARAADANSQAGYTTGLQRALRADAQISGTLADLAALGYGKEDK